MHIPRLTKLLTSRIYNLGRLRIYSLGDERVLVYILVYRGIIVRNLSTRYTLAYKVNSEIT
jgi:hypothetical protein